MGDHIKDQFVPFILTITILAFIVCRVIPMAKETQSLREENKNFRNILYYNNVICQEVSITSYQLTKKQTDKNPKESASGKNLTGHPNACAISRDLKVLFEFGDTIKLVYDGIEKNFIVEDIMNKRFNNRIDILSNKPINTKGYVIK